MSISSIREAVYHVCSMAERRHTAAQRNKTIILLRASTGTEARRRSCRGRSGQRSGWQGKLLCFLLFPLRTQQNKNFVALGVELCYHISELKESFIASGMNCVPGSLSSYLYHIDSIRIDHCSAFPKIRLFPKHVGFVCFCGWRLQIRSAISNPEMRNPAPGFLPGFRSHDF